VWAKPTHVQATHEGQLSVNKTEFLVVGPVENHIIRCSIQGLEGILRNRGEVKGSHGQILKARPKLGKNVIPAWVVVRVPKHLDAWVEGFQGMLGVLAKPCLSSYSISNMQFFLPPSSL
jgi:hypothetical protein